VTSPFFGLDIASRALRTQQTLVSIANQNIANANTPGFSRQVAVVKETLPYPIPVFRQSGQAGQLGTGVDVTEVNRARDTFLDYQYRGQISSKGSWDAQNTALDQIQAVVNEPSSSGLSTLVTKYFQSWQEVANSPSDVSVRANLLEQGRTLASSIQGTVQQYMQQKRDADQQVALTVKDVNNYAQQVANLNVQISQVETGGLHANDLRDQRDLLIDKLATITKVTTVESAEGSLNVYIGGHQLVDRNTAHKMDVDTTSGPVGTVIWADGTGSGAVAINGGKLAGLETARDTLIQGRIDSLNALASRVIQSVNSVHAAGVGIDGTGGLNFFTGTDATNIAVDPTLTANHVAAARQTATGSGTYTHASGDSTNAVALAQLQNTLAQVGTTGLAIGQSVGAGTVSGVDVAGAAVNKTFTFSYTAGSPPTVQVSDGTTSVNATWTVASNTQDGTAPTRDLYTVNAGQLGVRVTFSVAAGTATNTALSGLNTQTVTSTGPATITDQYAREVSTIGVLASTAKGQANNQQVLVNQLQNQRQQSAGVSLDEEATHLIQYQRAYQAAARVISVVDSMLDTLINNTGHR
jgi:flagellar hook-associated protein 1 FlgK